MMVLARAAWFLVLSAGPATEDAAPIRVDQVGDPTPVGETVGFFLDTTGDLPFAAVSTPAFAHRFAPGRAQDNGFGYRRGAVWVRLLVENRSDQAVEWILDTGYELLDEVDLFAEDLSGEYLRFRSGVRVAYRDRPVQHRSPAFVVDTAPGHQLLFLRVASTGPLNLPLRVASLDRHQSHHRSQSALLWLYYGIMLSMLIYNAFLYAAVRDRAYLSYVVFIAAYSMFQLIHNGLAGALLWPETGGADNPRLVFFGFFVAFGMLSFSRRFLDTARSAPRADRLLGGAALLFLVGAPLPLVWCPRQLHQVGSILIILTTVGLLWVGVSALRRGYRPARLYSLAWGVLLIGILLGLLKANGLLPIGVITTWGYQFASAVEVLLLSLALADRINAIRHSLEDLNHQLEQKVEARTERLAQANRELGERSVQLERSNDLLATANRHLHDEIVERQRAEQARRDAEERLAQSQKMEAIGRLAGGIAHDMNNVLAAIMSFAEVHRDELSPEHPGRQDMAEVLSATQRGRDLTTNLLGFARKGQFEKRAISINEVIDEVVTLLSRTVSKKIRIETVLRAELSEIDGDSTQVFQILLNLCLNAVDAMSDSGTLTIATDDESHETEVDRPDSAKVTHRLALEVRDTGVGMDAETLQHAFEPFFTTKPKGKGSGLGLAMVYGAVVAHGGTVELRSTVGKGTTVRLTLPARAPTSVAQPRPTAVERRGRGLGTVLFVDDEPALRRIGKRVLERDGFEVVCASDGAEAISLFDQSAGTISVVILDMLMPVMNGAETFSALRQRAPELCVIISSGYADKEDTEALLRAGAMTLLAKPYSPARLSQAVALATGGRLAPGKNDGE